MPKSPETYADGAATMANLLLVEQAGRGLLDVTVHTDRHFRKGKSGAAREQLLTFG